MRTDIEGIHALNKDRLHFETITKIPYLSEIFLRFAFEISDFGCVHNRYSEKTWPFRFVSEIRNPAAEIVWISFVRMRDFCMVLCRYFSTRLEQICEPVRGTSSFGLAPSKASITSIYFSGCLCYLFLFY